MQQPSQAVEARVRFADVVPGLMRFVHGKVANPVLRKTVHQLLLQRLQPDAARADDNYICTSFVGALCTLAMASWRTPA